MPRAIVYCDRCGRLVPPNEVAKGVGIFSDKGSLCSACAGLLTPEQRATVIGVPVPAAAPAPRPEVRPGSGRRPALPGAVPAAPRAPTRRFRADDVGKRAAPPQKQSQGILIAGVAAGVLAGLAATLVLVSGRARGRKPARADPGTKVTVAPADPNDRPPAPEPPKAVVSQETREAAARGLAAIKAMHEPSLARYGEMCTALESLQQEFAGTPAADEAAAFLEKLDTEYAEFAEIALLVAIDAARQLTSEGRHAEAEAGLRSVGERYGAGRWYEKRGKPAVEEALARIRKEIEQISSATLATARERLQAGDARGARAALATSGVWPPDVRAKADELRREAGGGPDAADGCAAGLAGEYYDGHSMVADRLRLRRVDATIFFDWGNGSPAPGVPSDRFSARWTGDLMVPVDGLYRFRIHHDDSAVLVIDGRTVAEFRGEKVGMIEGTAELRAGWRPIRIDFEEYGGGAIIKIEWAGPGFAMSPIPPDSLRTRAADAGATRPAGPHDPCSVADRREPPRRTSRRPGGGGLRGHTCLAELEPR